MGNGMVIDPWALEKEIAELARAGSRSSDNLVISDRAHLILPHHRALEGADRGAAGRPEDRHHAARDRPGLRGQGGPPRDRMGDLLRPATLPAQARGGAAPLRADLPRRRPRRPTSTGTGCSTTWPASASGRRRGSPTPRSSSTAQMAAATRCSSRARRRRCSTSTTARTRSSRRRRRWRPAPPPASASRPRASTACSASPRPTPRAWARGRFPTEIGGRARGEGPRARRRSTAPPPAGRAAAAGSTPWSVRYAARVNGFDSLALTKLDVLDELAEIQVCTAYRSRGRDA